MKKIILSLTITPTDDDVSSEDLLRSLRRLGSVCSIYESEVEVVYSNEGSPRSVWIYVSADESETYKQVEKAGDTDGWDLDSDTVEEMQDTGVCTEFVAHYPRIDTHGAPAYLCDDVFAQGIVGAHGFSVPPDNQMKVHSSDIGDDSPEVFWLKIALPAA